MFALACPFDHFLRPVKRRDAPWLSLLAAALVAEGNAVAGPEHPQFLESVNSGGFPLVEASQAAPFFIDRADFKVVEIGANALADDVQRVTGRKPEVKNGTPAAAPAVVLIGTLGKNALIDRLVADGKMKVEGLPGRWEGYTAATVANPFPGVGSALVIAGSDRRGTAFGVFACSEAIGVSPWYWWADVVPRHRERLAFAAGTYTSKPPSVKYRGIFLNDEDWGLQPWAAKTFEPETNDIGPKTYAKICELLLRLKANYLWPAMHPSTKAFDFYPANKVVADDYAIVMGSSHAEPMLRNNVGEWDEARGAWDYDQNHDGIIKYWEERVQENGRYENVFTLGMRGIHDSGMPGGGSTTEKVTRLQRVLADQRAIIARQVNPQPAQVPQIFVPYKEVLALYQNGLQVPDDVTLVWPDDNHGYLRQLSTPEEQRRAGGAGVYYHLSYWGKPEDYLWLCTTPPALVWEEMRKAYDHGARTVWVANVGDLKPAEIDLEFFLRMAWDITPWDASSQPRFLAAWAERNFGPEQAAEIAAILDEYYQLNYPAKPEHLLHAQFSFTNYDEAGQRLWRFAQLVARADALYAALPAEQRDAAYELLVYPVRGSALMNEMQLHAAHSRLLAAQNDPAAGEFLAKAHKAHEQIQTETAFYNDQVAGGKWRGIMSANPRKQPVFAKLDPAAKVVPEPAASTASSTAYVSLEAEHPTRQTAGGETAWQVIASLGRSGDSIALRPTTAAIPAGAVLEYDFTAAPFGPVKALVYCLPTHAIHRGVKLRYSAAIDGETPQVVDLDTEEFSAKWSENVLRAAALGTTEHTLGTAGKHTLKLRPLDPGLVFDKVVIDLGGLLPSHLGPPENASVQ